jgi:hypothetical protein
MFFVSLLKTHINPNTLQKGQAMMRKPLACPECGRTEPDEPVMAELHAGVTMYPLTELDPLNCPGCWDAVKHSNYGLPHVNGKPIPRPAEKQGPAPAARERAESTP